MTETAQAMTAPPSTSERDARRRRTAELVFVAVFGLLLFARLGHDALWSEEAITATLAHELVESGELGGFGEHALLAYRRGHELAGARDLVIGPLQYFLAAPFVAIGGVSAFWARVPFALSGIGLAILVCVWLRRERVRLSHSLMLFALVAANVTLLLALRQARYYAPAILASALAAYAYLSTARDWRRVIALALSGWALLATHHAIYLAVVSAFAIDFIAWGGRGRRARTSHLFALAASQILFIGAYTLSTLPPLVPISPTALAGGATLPLSFFARLGANLHALNAYEIAPLALVVAAPVLHAFAGWRDHVLPRASVAIAVMLLVVSLTTRDPADGEGADIGPLIVMLPLALLLTWRVVVQLARRHAPAALAALAVLALSNTAYLPFFGDEPAGLRSTPLAYLRELARPHEDPNQLTATWLRRNVGARSTVWVSPTLASFALAHQAPDIVFAWQLPAAARARFGRTAAMHFFGADPPAYVVAFGNEQRRVRAALGREDYTEVATLAVWGQGLTRTDLVGRLFRPRVVDDPAGDGVTILRRRPAGLLPVPELFGRSRSSSGRSLREGVMRFAEEILERARERRRKGDEDR